MPAKDYYVILGIAPSESQASVKSAFRDLAQRYHPDRAGTQSTPHFQEIVEAYRVLGDRARRAAYDKSRAQARSVEAAPSPARTRAPVEAFDADPVTTPRPRTVSPVEQQGAVPRGLGGFYPAFKALNLVLVLSPEKALRGGEVRLGVPVFSSCTDCRGTGGLGFYRCPRCQGTGQQRREETVTLRVPAMLGDGALFRIPLHSLGLPYLNLRIRVRP